MVWFGFGFTEGLFLEDFHEETIIRCGSLALKQIREVILVSAFLKKLCENLSRPFVTFFDSLHTCKSINSDLEINCVLFSMLVQRGLLLAGLFYFPQTHAHTHLCF